MRKESDHLFRIVLIGYAEVGKSSILLKFVCGEFTQNYVPTIGVDFKTKILNYQDQEIKLQVSIINIEIWDTAGQEKFKIVTSSYQKKANGIIIIFDLTNRQSFVDVPQLIEQTKKNADQGVIWVLLGNKSDLDQKREVSIVEAKELALHYNMEYIETSCLNLETIEQPFVNIVDSLLLNKLEKEN